MSSQERGPLIYVLRVHSDFLTWSFTRQSHALTLCLQCLFFQYLYRFITTNLLILPNSLVEEGVTNIVYGISYLTRGKPLKPKPVSFGQYLPQCLLQSSHLFPTAHYVNHHDNSMQHLEKKCWLVLFFHPLALPYFCCCSNLSR